MNLKSCVETETNRRKLEVEVDAETFAKACDAAYHKKVGRLSVPGFRKGKAPRNVIERMYGKEFFYEDAVNNVYQDALTDAIKVAGLEYVDDKIDLDVVSVGEDGLVFTAVITVKPDVKVNDYKGIKAERPSTVVTDEQVDKELEGIRESKARSVDVDRAAENGDTAVFDFAGFVDDVPFEGGTAEDYTLELGSGNFIPGFEEQMVGHSAGEEFDVNVTFPEEYHAEELAGKPAVFKIKLHTVRAKELLPLDDEFAKDYSEFDTLEEYKADIRTGLEKKAADNSKNVVDGQLTDALVNLLEAEIPDAMYENRIDHNMQDFAYRLRSQGIGFEDYLKYVGTSVEQMRAQMKDQAEHQVKLRLALEYIAKTEKLEVSDEALDEEYKKLADQYNMDMDAVKQAIDAEDLRGDLLVERAIEFVRDNAEISDCE